MQNLHHLGRMRWCRMIAITIECRSLPPSNRALIVATEMADKRIRRSTERDTQCTFDKCLRPSLPWSHALTVALIRLWMSEERKREKGGKFQPSILTTLKPVPIALRSIVRVKKDLFASEYRARLLHNSGIWLIADSMRASYAIY